MKLICIRKDDNLNPHVFENVDKIEQSVLRPDTWYIFFTDGTCTNIFPREEYTYQIEL